MHYPMSTIHLLMLLDQATLMSMDEEVLKMLNPGPL